MAQLSPTLILYPLFAMFLLMALVLAYMARTRLAAITSKRVSMSYYKDYRGEEPEEMQVIARHFINLFEMPTLFYVVVILAYVTQQVSYWMVGCAWAYVAVRYLHSFIHLGSNHVPTRFRVYFLSALVLAVMWGSLLTKLLQAG